MSTKKFQNIEEVYQCLTDFEIEDDSNKDGIPCADIKVQGLHRVKIKQVSIWDYYNYLCPMKDKMLSYYAQSMVRLTSEEDLKRASKSISNLVDEFTGMEPDKIKEKSLSLSYFMQEEQVRYEFFQGLKKMRILKLLKERMVMLGLK